MTDTAEARTVWTSKSKDRTQLPQFLDVSQDTLNDIREASKTQNHDTIVLKRYSTATDDELLASLMTPQA